MTDKAQGEGTEAPPRESRDPFFVLAGLAAEVFRLVSTDAHLEAQRAKAWIRWKALKAVRLFVLCMGALALMWSGITLLISGLALELAEFTGSSEGVAKSVVGATTAGGVLVLLEIGLRLRAAAFRDAARERFLEAEERSAGA